MINQAEIVMGEVEDTMGQEEIVRRRAKKHNEFSRVGDGHGKKAQ